MMRYFPTVWPRKNIVPMSIRLVRCSRVCYIVPCGRGSICRVGAAVAACPRDEAAHLVRVLRLGAGADVEVFDGRGGEWKADVDEPTSTGDGAAARSRPVRRRNRACRSRLVISVLKGGKMDDIVRDAVMIGAAAIHP